MSRPSTSEHLQPEDRKRLREAAEQLEQAWRGQSDIDLALFLPPPNDPLYGPLLERLVTSDLQMRRSRGQAVSLDYYLEKYAQLGSARDVPVRLIYEEYRVLRQFGGSLDLEQYRQRFPDQFAELERLVGQQFLPTEMETCGDLTTPMTPLTRLPSVAVLRSDDILAVGEGYRLIKCIGSGSFGEVWEVEAPGGFPAAMKIIRRTLDSAEAKRELRALEVIKRLSHPHLLKTQAAWALQDRLIILMDLADCTLRNRLDECRAAGAVGIPVVELLRYFQEAAEAFDYLHGEKVLHRDVKPQNLLLCHGHVKVADFGLVRDQKQHRVAESLSGTPGYMSPEAWGCAPCAASDQYSLALTYAELRLGRWPYEGNEAVVLAHMEGTPDLAPLGEAERVVLLRGLAKRRTERYPTCQALVSALREALPGDPAAHDLQTARPPKPSFETKDALAPQRDDSSRSPTRSIAKHETQGDLLDTTFNPSANPAIGQMPAPSKDRIPVNPTREPGNSRQPLQVAVKEQQVVEVRRVAGKKSRLLVVASAVALLLFVAIGGVVWYLITKPSVDLLDPQPKGAFPSAGTAKAVAISKNPLDGSNTTYPPKIVRNVGEQKRQVIFVLIQPEGSKDAPFYLMQNKVCNAIFRAFADACPQAIPNDLWKQGGVANGRNVGDADELPVFRVTRSEAAQCAAWLGGSLPTARQLDQAAGYYSPRDGRNGPGRAPLGVVQDVPLGPRKITESDALSRYGIRDLLGNGREWTRDDVTSKDDKHLAVLRGRSYTAAEPLSFADLDEWNKNPKLCPVLSPDYRSWTTSFRVVIEPPNQSRGK